MKQLSKSNFLIEIINKCLDIVLTKTGDRDHSRATHTFLKVVTKVTDVTSDNFIPAKLQFVLGLKR
jgi:hypothetical protein